MKKDRLLNPSILREVAALGHTEGLCIADCGLPIPKGVRVIDVSVMSGVPTFMEVLRAVNSELLVEAYVLAEEISERNPALELEIVDELGPVPGRRMSHDDFKRMTQTVKCVIRTGETSPYANIILIGGVNF